MHILGLDNSTLEDLDVNKNERKKNMNEWMNEPIHDFHYNIVPVKIKWINRLWFTHEMKYYTQLKLTISTYVKMAKYPEYWV